MSAKSTPEKFWSRVDIRGADECWLWTGSLAHGYGSVTYRGKSRYAHVVAWELTNGQPPFGTRLVSECGNRNCVNTSHWRVGPWKHPFLGFRSAALEVVSVDEGKNDRGAALVRVRCDCGTEKVVPWSRISGGGDVSCGCAKRSRIGAASIRHGGCARGGAAASGYSAWQNMIARCERETHRDYHHYGGRGICVCERWHEFENFMADMGQRSPGMTIERIDNDGNYEPANCRWATRKEQSRNTRRTRRVLVDGVETTLVDACEAHGIAVGSVETRLKFGWSIEEALKTPVRKVRRAA